MSTPTRTLRVLQLDPSIGFGVQQYRVEHLTEQLQRVGAEVRVGSAEDLNEAWIGSRLADFVDGLDLVILHRFPWSVAVAALIDAARVAGVTTAFEADDLVFVPGAERWVDGVRHLDAPTRELYDTGVERYSATYRACDVFLGSTSFLAGLRPFGPKRSAVLPNMLGQAHLDIAAKLGDSLEEAGGANEVVIGYGAGSRTHDRDLAVAGSALADVLQEFPQARLELVGPVDLPVELEPFADRVKRHDLQRWEDWWGLLSRWDVALAPLDERNPYCRAKSALKFYEAGVLGVPMVASRTDDFERVIDEGRNGRLASDTEQWREALVELVGDAERRRAMGAAARVDVMERHTTRSQAATTHAQLMALVDGGGLELVEDFRGFDLSLLVPSPFPGSGGHSNIFRVLRALGLRGHRCTLYSDINYVEGVENAEQLKAFVDERFLPLGVEYRTGWNVRPDSADAVMATSWATAEAVALVDAPAKIYFVQDWECMFVAAGEDWVRTERTYRLGLSCITLGHWLTTVMRGRYAADSISFPFPLHIESTTEPARPSQQSLTLAFLAQPSKPRRGYRTGLEALEQFHAQHPEVRIVFFGSRDVNPDEVRFPYEDRGIIGEAELERLYQEVDIGLVLSYSNPSLVPPNMMRCGCVVVDVDLEHNEYEYQHEVDSLLAEPTPWGIAAALSRLASDERLRESLRKHALATVADRSEERVVDVIEAGLVRGILTGRVEPRPQLSWYQGESDGFVGLEAGVVTQTVCVADDGLCEIALRLGTYAREAGDVAWRVREIAEGAVGAEALGGAVASGVWASAELRDNEWHRASFPALSDSAGRRYAVEVAMADRAAPAAALYVLGHAPREAGELLVNGQARGGVLQLQLRVGQSVTSEASRAQASSPASTTFDVVSETASVSGAAAGRARVESGNGGAAPTVSPQTRSPAPAPVPASAPASAASEAAAPRVAPSPPDAELDPRAPARELAEALRARAQEAAKDRARGERRVRAVETSLQGVESTMQRARKLLALPILRRPLTALKILGPTEHFLQGDRFVTPEICGPARVGQRLFADKGGLCSISLRFGTDRRRLEGMLTLIVREDRDGSEPLRRVTLSAATLIDNSYADFSFEPLPGTAPRKLLVEVGAEQVLRGSGPRLWGKGDAVLRGRERIQDGQRAVGSLDVQLRYQARGGAAAGFSAGA